MSIDIFEVKKCSRCGKLLDDGKLHFEKDCIVYLKSIVEEQNKYIKALEANTSKSVLRRLDLQLNRNEFEKE